MCSPFATDPLDHLLDPVSKLPLGLESQRQQAAHIRIEHLDFTFVHTPVHLYFSSGKTGRLSDPLCDGADGDRGVRAAIKPPGRLSA